MLVILDGWGIHSKPESSAIASAKTPIMDHLLKTKPHSQLITHGEVVGLPSGQMGNSEVGHLNIGAGRIVYQDLVKINRAISNGELDVNGKVSELIRYAEEKNRPFHLIGLCSDGGVHSHIDHLLGICDYLKDHFKGKVFIHAITDGRDTDPKSGLKNIEQIEKHIAGTNAVLSTIAGRYYAMDRDRRWNRTKIAYDALVYLKGDKIKDPIKWLKDNYRNGRTDEFLLPAILDESMASGFKGIQDEDVVFFFNFRTDRPRQLTMALSQKDFPDYGMKKLDLKFLTMTSYDRTFKDIVVLFEKEDISETLGEVLSRNGKTQVRISETEKYPHVTFFFSGGQEREFPGEVRLMIPSPKVATYDLQAEMSAFKVTDELIDYLSANQMDFVCINFANADMVGHTGVFDAAVKAVETVDQCLGKMLNLAEKLDYEVLIIADHGNCDYMINEDGSPNTAHTTNPVPCIYVGKDFPNAKLADGILADVAPTLLKLLGMEQPEKMTGQNLIRE